MIVPMKKVTLVVLDRHRAGSLQELRRAGVMHIHFDSAVGAGDARVEQLRAERDTVNRALTLLTLGRSAPAAEAAAEGDPLEVARRVLAGFEREQTAAEEIAQLRRLESALEPWGDFSPVELKELSAQGVTVRLATMSRSEAAAFAAASPERALVTVSEKGNLLRVAVLALGGASDDLPGAQLAPAERGLAEVRSEIGRLEAEIEDLRAQRNADAAHEAGLSRALGALTAEIEFERVKLGMASEGPLVHVTGFVPHDRVERLEQSAARGGWAVLVEDPSEDDPVPTLVRNPAWVRIVEPMFNFLGIAPGYSEHDISPWFLLSFAVFWAMIIGDAGYGLLYLALVFWARSRMRKSPPEFFRLVIVMSVATVVWGALTGTWFGSRALADLPPLRALTVNAIASFPRGRVDTNTNIMAITFVIGAVHLSLAHILSFLKKLPGLDAFAELGWLLVLWGMYCLIQIMVLGRPAQTPVLGGLVAGMSLLSAAAGLVLAGLVFVALFAEQKGRLVKGALMGLAWLPLRLMGCIGAFADQVSYVRLFAVGLAGFKIADAFNTMAAAVGRSLPPAAVLITVLGHSLNVALGSMALLVHGVRLNLLEFSSHLGMEWKGQAYSPFRES